MTVSPELASQIEQESNALTQNDLRKPGISINRFMNNYSKILAGVENDLQILVSAGFDSSTLPRSRALFELLSLAYGEYRGKTQKSAERKKNFDQQMTIASMDKKRLRIVCSYIAKKCEDKNIQQNIRTIKSRTGIVDTLNDNLAMVAIIREYPQIALQVKPGGLSVDDSYCNEVKNRAVELLMLRGLIINRGKTQDDTMDRLNRLLTLCIKVVSEIKMFAKIAFFDNPNYYSSNYSTYIRSKNNNHGRDKK